MHDQPPNVNPPPLAALLSYSAFVEKLATKDRVNAEKHVTFCEADPDPRHAILWRRLVCGLMALAGHSAKLNREPQSVQFYVADGKYRMQVFTLEAAPPGAVIVYCADVLDQVVESGALTVQKGAGHIGTYQLSRSHDTLAIERLDADTPSPAAHFKAMLGWNRKALRMTLPVGATASQIEVVEALCALAVRSPADGPLGRSAASGLPTGR
jgi:hypothetical protein